MTPPTYPTFELNGWRGNAVDVAGVEWYVLATEGLDDTPAASATQYANIGDGAAIAPVRYEPRTIALSGTAVAPTPYEARAAIDRLRAAVVSARGKATVTIRDLTGDRIASVVPAEAVKTTPINATAFRFQLSLLAGDPLLYDTTEQTATTTIPGVATATTGFGFSLAFPISFGGATLPGDVALLNAGTAATFPVLRLDGPLTSATIRNNTTGQQLSIVYTLAAGDWLDIDTAARSILLNGTANRRSALQVGSRWPSLVPGYNAVQFRGQGAGSLTVRWRSAWL